MTEFERSTFEATRLVAQPAAGAAAVAGVAGVDDAKRAIERCRVLLSDRGEVSGERLASEALTAYEALNGSSLDAFFTHLTEQFAPDTDAIASSLHAVRQHPSSETLAALQIAMEPPRRELFRRLNLARGGMPALIELRRRVLRGLASHPEWAVISADLEHLLRSWLNAGFLELRRIDWHTPTPILENLIKYEAVHRIRDWADLRRRLQDDRRCFGFFHPSLPNEPLIFTELALTGELSARVQPLLDPESPVLDRKSRSFAVFYSISSCHDGLRGISFGNSLIRRVVDTLRGEYPRLRTFGTLSPIPGFRSWLAQAAKNGDSAAAAVSTLADTNCFSDSARTEELARTLLPLCATYLLTAKRGDEPADPVARFHLGNGARLERINWLGDTSPAGIERSGSLTANYLYRLSDVERNHRAYATERRVVASRQVHLTAFGGLAIAS
jgi:malonyl-CoA decarboxylase